MWVGSRVVDKVGGCNVTESSLIPLTKNSPLPVQQRSAFTGSDFQPAFRPHIVYSLESKQEN
jgi:hypothetical protein